MKNLAVIQARMGSSRFPGKVLASLGQTNVITWVIDRVGLSKNIDDIVVAIPDNERDDQLAETLKELGVKYVRGSESDVLGRFVDVADNFSPATMIRITADCPFIDPEVIDQCIDEFYARNLDYCSNVAPPTFPDGMDVEVFSTDALYQISSIAKSSAEREHVTLAMRESTLFKIGNVRAPHDWSSIRITVDTREDLSTLERLVTQLKPNQAFTAADIADLHARNGDTWENQHLTRNFGFEVNSGQKLWQRAKNVIPGGNMLLSKRSEMFLPDRWPTYFDKAKGCHLWDLEGSKYLDMCLMGVGTNVLGYGNKAVDEAVRKTVAKGNLSTLNCPEEVALAERLVELHPWSGMVRLARTGGEANAMSVRIARSASGKDHVAVCGYHGWHDWYLSANLGATDNLDGHILPGLSTSGVPQNLRNTVHPFTYGDIDRLTELVDSFQIGTIKMEVQRSTKPDVAFLKRIREIADANGIVLIFDECTSGFREAFGGLHLNLGVCPDICILGKTLGNGYAITAVLGTTEVMTYAQNSFISSTFWTERIGPSAALATLGEMEQTKSWQTISSIGGQIKRTWQTLAEKHKLNITIGGLDALANFSFETENTVFKTFITQEMLKSKILASNAVYSCVEHKQSDLDRYFNELDSVFHAINLNRDPGKLRTLLDGPPCHDGFKRLN